MAVSRWSTSVLSGLSTDTEPTIVVTFDSAKYVFNVGENTGRAWLQSKSNKKKTKGLFFTSVGTQRTSGLPGLLMSLADAGIRRLSIIGPQGILHSLAAMRLYTYRSNLGVDAIEVDDSVPETTPNPTYVDQNIKLYSIPIHPEGHSNALKRKHESSPELSSKRVLFSNEGTPSEWVDAASTPVPLVERMRLGGFSPSGLQGEDAQEWRNLTIEHMFPWKEPPPPPPKARKQKRGRANAQVETMQVDPEPTPSEPVPTPPPKLSRKSPLAFNPSGCDKQLPKFIYTRDGEPIAPSLKPTLAYVVVGPRTRGKFDDSMAKSLGLFGKLRGQVANGKTVTFTVTDAAGVQIERTVKPEECLGPSENPGAVIILDVPSPAHISALISSFADSPLYSKFRSHRDEDRDEFVVNAVYHICGEGVLEDNRYKEFMRGFSPHTNHLVSSRQHNPDPVTFTSAAYNQLILNNLDKEMFPLPQFNLNPSIELEDVPNLPKNVYAMHSHNLVEMRPPKPPRTDPLAEEIDPFHVGVSTSTPLALPEPTFAKFAEAQKLVQDYKAVAKPILPGDSVTILPLGTSSALPSKYRNVSGNLIQVPKWGNILLETGEGTWGQLARHFGTSSDLKDNVWDILRDVKCIFISHAHADHHMGLAKILAMRKKLDPPPCHPVYLVTLNSVHVGLRELSDIENLGIDYNPRNNGVVPIYSNALNYKYRDDPDRMPQSAVEDMCKALGLRDLFTVEVWHRTHCYGVVIDHQDGWSIVFSGDTQPTEKLVEAGMNATLLIHEATMADEQVEMARAKAHSTIGQAIDIGKRMNAENILLTHFSARYPKMPPSILKSPVPASSDEPEPTIGLAFDHANIRLGEFWKLNMYLPAIEQTFGDTVEEGDEDQDLIILQAD